ncbi:protein-L-isoaspartate(D-aspartate) O-methyltransferase [soil metagenome]
MLESRSKTSLQEQLTRGSRGISDPRVLEAMLSVPREQFVPEDLRADAYADSPLPIGHGQTISQPYIVALMTEMLDPDPSDRVLEIGTGCGYQAAVLSRLVAQVYSVEIVEPLARRARETLRAHGYDNVHLRIGDGSAGWPEEAPFDAVIVTCAPESVPQPLIDQLHDGGRMIIPVGEPGGRQDLYLLRKTEHEVVQESVLPVRFVPMTHS